MRTPSRSHSGVAFALALAVVCLSLGCNAPNGAREEDPISGTWYGGSTFPDHQGYKYQYVFSPMAHGRWQVLGEGVYGPDTFGAAIKTFWSGEIRKIGDSYELRLMSLTSTDATEPPEVLPTIIAGRAVLNLLGPDEMKLEYNTAGMWKWGTTVFVDDPEVWMYKPGSGGPTIEILRRLKTDGEIKL
jgi:hypothetical protein